MLLMCNRNRGAPKAYHICQNAAVIRPVIFVMLLLSIFYQSCRMSWSQPLPWPMNTHSTAQHNKHAIVTESICSHACWCRCVHSHRQKYICSHTQRSNAKMNISPNRRSISVKICVYMRVQHIFTSAPKCRRQFLTRSIMRWSESNILRCGYRHDTMCKWLHICSID